MNMDDDKSGPEAEQREAVWEGLLGWYAREGRAGLPWRHTRDPYAVLVSEVMLQQTQVDRVVPKYEAFLRRFPTLDALARAPIGAVIREWAGLGYNVRAVRLWEIARQAVAEYGGALPGTLVELLRLRGVGRYTAGAVACFAFGQPVATVDTNIRRVLWRVFRGVEPARWATGTRAAADALSLATWALPAARAYDWQQALMDLGATICLPRRPLCARCPLATQCRALAEAGSVALFPSGDDVARLREARMTDRAIAEPRATYDAKSPARTPVPFTSTARYFRGRIIATLRDLPGDESLSLAELGPRIREGFAEADMPWLRALLARLERDGLLCWVRHDGYATDTVALPGARATANGGER